MCVLIFGQVFFRYALDMPLSWTEELSRHLMIWSAFLGAAVAFRRRAHLGIDLLATALEKRTRNGARYLDFMLSFAILVLSVYLTVRGVQMSQRVVRQLSSALNIRMSWIYSSVPAGFLLIALFSIERIAADLLRKDGQPRVSSPTRQEA